MSARRVLEQVARTLQLTGGLLLAVFSVQFALRALEERRARVSAPAPVPSEDRRALAASAAASAPSAAAPLTAAPPTPPAPSGTPLRMSLVVDARQPRAEVYVAGVRVGETPFVGEVSCRAGSSVKIEVLQRQGPPVSFERPCSGSATLRAE